MHRRFDIEKVHDIAFVGNVFPGPRAELIALLQRRFRSMFVGRAYFEEMARVYSAARLVFNRSLKNDVNMRVFEAVACGSLLLTNELADNGQAELFRDGVHLATYRDADELLDKAAYYLKHEALRERIAAAGRAEAMARHTYRHRMQTVLSGSAGKGRSLGCGRTCQRAVLRRPRRAITSLHGRNCWHWSRHRRRACLTSVAVQVGWASRSRHGKRPRSSASRSCPRPRLVLAAGWTKSSRETWRDWSSHLRMPLSTALSVATCWSICAIRSGFFSACATGSPRMAASLPAYPTFATTAWSARSWRGTGAMSRRGCSTRPTSHFFTAPRHGRSL